MSETDRSYWQLCSAFESGVRSGSTGTASTSRSRRPGSGPSSSGGARLCVSESDRKLSAFQSDGLGDVSDFLSASRVGRPSDGASSSDHVRLCASESDRKFSTFESDGLSDMSEHCEQRAVPPKAAPPAARAAPELRRALRESTALRSRAAAACGEIRDCLAALGLEGPVRRSKSDGDAGWGSRGQAEAGEVRVPLDGSFSDSEAEGMARGPHVGGARGPFRGSVRDARAEGRSRARSRDGGRRAGDGPGAEASGGGGGGGGAANGGRSARRWHRSASGIPSTSASGRPGDGPRGGAGRVRFCASETDRDDGLGNILDVLSASHTGELRASEADRGRRSIEEREGLSDVLDGMSSAASEGGDAGDDDAGGARDIRDGPGAARGDGAGAARDRPRAPRACKWFRKGLPKKPEEAGGGSVARRGNGGAPQADGVRSARTRGRDGRAPRLGRSVSAMSSPSLVSATTKSSGGRAPSGQVRQCPLEHFSWQQTRQRDVLERSWWSRSRPG